MPACRSWRGPRQDKPDLKASTGSGCVEARAPHVLGNHLHGGCQVAIYCTNRLIVTGDEAEVSRFCSYVSDYVSWDPKYPDAGREASLCKSFLPMPDVIAAPRSAEQWEQANWGAASGDLNTVVTQRMPGRVSFAFFSRWAPPLMAIYAGAERWQTLCFEGAYLEPGLGLMGEYEFQAPVALTDDERADLYFGESDVPVDDETDCAWWAVREAACAIVTSGSMRRQLS